MSSNLIAIIALLISVASLYVSAHVAFRDRARLKFITNLYEASEFGPDRLHVAVVNRGRRVAILRMSGGTDAGGEWGATFIDHEKGGHRLAEHERYEFEIKKEDTVDFTPDEKVIAYDVLWIEDSLGVRHEIPGSREFIRKLHG